MIRPATSADIPTLIFLIGRQFVREAGYEALGVTMNPEKTHKNLERLIEGGAGAVFVAERDGRLVGAIGLARGDLYFSDDPMAIEQFWWMHPDHRNGMDGARLLKRALAWASEVGVKIFAMVDLPHTDSRAADMYQRLGGKLMERTWVWRM